MEFSQNELNHLFLFLRAREKELPDNMLSVFRKIEKEIWNHLSIEDIEKMGNGREYGKHV